ncbi:YcaO-like family protein [Taklimakanibacter lacteus]|uniref:YcaO-like family protein n=1 Tax=Taklimakanibacter lacteus TaxID=2268456 RepID=UPI000E66FB5F
MATDAAHAVVLAEARALRTSLACDDPASGSGHHTARSPTDLVAELEPHLSSFGVTRVGDITGLDVIGIPVFFACRPNSWSLSVCQGKSMHADQARLGAIMECMEQALAERSVDMVVRRASREDMSRQGLRCLGESAMLRSTPKGFDKSRDYYWMQGISLKDGCDVYAPYELVGLDLRIDSTWDHAAFRMSSVGLAAGASLCDAVLHATLELVEHDATALIDLFGLAAGIGRPLVHRHGSYDELDRAVAMVEKAGLTCSFAEIAGKVGMPTIAAFIAPGNHESTGRIFAGFACRCSPEESALAALLEAAQSRVTQISGARDDLSPDDYARKSQRLKFRPGNEAFLDSLATSCVIDKTASPLWKLRHVVGKIFQAGVEDIFVFPLGGGGAGVRAARVLMPSMQAAAGKGVVQVGVHLLTSLLRNAEERV